MAHDKITNITPKYINNYVLLYYCILQQKAKEKKKKKREVVKMRQITIDAVLNL